MSHNNFKYMPPAILDMIDLMVIQIDENPWVYPPKEITQHPGSQSEDQTEWLELLRNYMEENLSLIQKAIDSETESQQLSHVPSALSLSFGNSNIPAPLSDSTVSLPQARLESAHANISSTLPTPATTALRSALTTPSTTAVNSPIIAPSNYPHIVPSGNFSTLPTSSQTHSVPHSVVPSRTGSVSSASPPTPYNKPGDDQSITDIESLRNLLKINGGISENSDPPKHGVQINSKTIDNDSTEKSRNNNDTHSSRAAKRMGFVVKRPARADSLDSVSSQLSLSSNAKNSGNNVAPPMAISASAGSVLGSHSETNPSKPASSIASNHLDSLKSASSPASPDDPVGSIDSIGSMGSFASNSSAPSSNLAWSPSKKRAQPLPSVLSSRSHSRQLSRESNSDAGTIGSSSTTNIDLVERSPTAAYHNTNTFSHSRSSSGDDHHSRFNNSSHLLAPTHSHHLTAVSGSHTGNTYQIPSSRLRSPNVNLIRERSHSVSVTSSPEKDTASGEYFRWLSTVNEEMKPLMHPSTISSLPQKSKEAKELLNLQRKIIIAARDILFSLVEFHSIMRRCTRLCNDKTITSEMHNILYTGQSYNDKLVKMLEQEESRLNNTLQSSSSKKDPADEIKASKASIKTIAAACIASIRNFKQMVQFCNEHLFRFTAAVDVKFIRCIILVTFGSFNELYNSWNMLNEIENPLGYNNTVATGNQTSLQTSTSLSSSYIAAGLDTLPLPHSNVGNIPYQASSPTTPSISPSSNIFFQRGSTSSNVSPVSGSSTYHGTSSSASASANLASFAEADEQLYHGLEAAATAAKVLLKQLTETLTKIGREMREPQTASRQQNGQPAISGNVKAHVKSLSEKCQAGVGVTKKLKQQLEIIRKSKSSATNMAETNGNNIGSMKLSNGHLQMDMVDRFKIWEDMNAFVKGMIGLLSSTKLAINDMPYLKNASNLATLTKLTKDIPPLMEASSYKVIISESKDREHTSGTLGSSSQLTNSKAHPTQIALPSYNNLTSMVMGPSTISGSSHTLPSYSVSSASPATTTAIPSANPFDYVTGSTNTQTTNLSYYPNNYNGIQFSATPSTPLAAVLGTTAAAAVVLPSPPINKVYTHSPFFPQMDSINNTVSSQPSAPLSNNSNNNVSSTPSAATTTSLPDSNKPNSSSSSATPSQLSTAISIGHLNIVTHTAGQHAPSLPSPLSGNLANKNNNGSSSNSSNDGDSGRYQPQGIHSRNHSNSNNPLHANGPGLAVGGSSHSPSHMSYLHAALSASMNSHKGTATAPHSAAHSRNHSNSSTHETWSSGTDNPSSKNGNTANSNASLQSSNVLNANNSVGNGEAYVNTNGSSTQQQSYNAPAISSNLSNVSVVSEDHFEHE